MAKGKKRGPKPGTMPKNYEQFAEARKQTQFAPGFSGQSTKQVEGTKHLKEWLDQYDNPPPTVYNPAALPLPVPVKDISPEMEKELERATKGLHNPTVLVPKTHEERVQEMVSKLRGSTRSRMIDNDPVSLIKNYKG